MLAALLVLVTGCASDGAEDSVTVLAAASLTTVFGELGQAFEAAHPSVGITFSFGASSTLAAQVRAGAPADALATADPSTMAGVAAAGLVAPPRTFARNRLAIVVRPGNPEGVSSLADLARPGLTVVLCAPEVPCGRLARDVLERSGVEVEPRSLEADVRAVVTRVVLGEADAGIVYATDVAAAMAGGRAAGVPIPSPPNVETSYPIAVVGAGRNPEGGRAFVEFVLSPPGQAVLARAGFAAP